MIFVNENIINICKGGVVTDNARDADLFPAFIHAKDKRVGERAFGAFARTAFCPIGTREKIEYHIHVKARGIGADGELIAVSFNHLGHGASLSHHGIIAEIKNYWRNMLLKPVRWKTFRRDFRRIQIGFLLFGLAITLMIRSNLGTSAWAVLEVALASKLHISIGTMTVLMGFIVLIGALLMREQLGWGTLANILSIGPWEDFWLAIIPSVKENLLLQSGMLLLAIFLMGLASAIYIGVEAGAGPRDSMMLAIKRTTGISIRAARAIIEVTVVTIGWLLGGPAGIGTVVFALLVGPSVQFGFKLFNVHPHGPEALIPQAPED
jgi:uncharacterized membrane protein YczE